MAALTDASETWLEYLTCALAGIPPSHTRLLECMSSEAFSDGLPAGKATVTADANLHTSLVVCTHDLSAPTPSDTVTVSAGVGVSEAASLDEQPPRSSCLELGDEMPANVRSSSPIETKTEVSGPAEALIETSTGSGNLISVIETSHSSGASTKMGQPGFVGPSYSETINMHSNSTTSESKDNSWRLTVGAHLEEDIASPALANETST
ncbi:unnamed protein product [Protopolystoma xenopodis]|uniref:Uncharacterized protein n=1 Tax=Protopolystoma xenopodis TaxID=117903 RepID=A0A3S5FCG2_9PLAT|nr:unnamed protein product [Protopolystoma xenopodis]